jgi:hypothetical protein
MTHRKKENSIGFGIFRFKFGYDKKAALTSRQLFMNQFSILGVYNGFP